MNNLKNYNKTKVNNINKPNKNHIYKIRKDKYSMNKAEQIKNKIKVGHFLKARKVVIKKSVLNYRYIDFNRYDDTLNLIREITRRSKKNGFGSFVERIFELMNKIMYPQLDEDAKSPYEEQIEFEYQQMQKEKQQKERLNADGSIDGEIIINNYKQDKNTEEQDKKADIIDAEFEEIK
jgi:hypothetical protein